MYLVPADLTVGQFVYVIRKRIKLSPEKVIFIFVDAVLPPTAALMSSIYEEHKDEDGYVTPSPLSIPPAIPLLSLPSLISGSWGLANLMISTSFLYITYSGENTFGDFEEIA